MNRVPAGLILRRVLVGLTVGGAMVGLAACGGGSTSGSGGGPSHHQLVALAAEEKPGSTHGFEECVANWLGRYANPSDLNRMVGESMHQLLADTAAITVLYQANRACAR